MTTNPPLEISLKVCNSLLEKLKRDRIAKELQWEEMLARATELQRFNIIEQSNRWKVRNDREVSILKSRISKIESLIVERDEAASKRFEARSWLITVKSKALESWLNTGGEESAFEASWPEMERQILMKNTMEFLDVPQGTERTESSAEQPDRFGKRASWGKRKPPLAPGEKRRKA